MSTRGQPRVSLFPFMSVLACTIGALMLLLVAMSLSAVGATDAATQAYLESKNVTAVERQWLDEEKRRIDEAEALWAEVDAVLVARGLTAGLSGSSIERELARTDQRDGLVAALADVEREIEKIEAERDQIETEIDVLESRRETLPIMIDPTNLSRHLVPYFIECDRAGATAFRVTDDFEYFVATADLSASGDFGRYLRRVRAEPGSLLVLLVRPDGLATERRVAQIAADAGIRVARLPLPGQGELDWSLLRRAESARPTRTRAEPSGER